MKLKTRIFALLLVCLCLYSIILPAFANDAYSYSVKLNYNNLTEIFVDEYTGESTPFGNDVWGEGFKHHREIGWGAIFTMFKDWDSSMLTSYENELTNGNAESMKKFFIGTKDSAGVTGMKGWKLAATIPSQSCMAFTFPAYHPDLLESSHDKTGDDEALVIRLQYITTNLNMAMSWVLQETYGADYKFEPNEVKLAAAKVATGATRKQAQTINGKTVSFSTPSSAPDNAYSLIASDHVVITIGSESKTFAWKTPKGYYETVDNRTDSLYVKTPDNYRKVIQNTNGAGDEKVLNWGYIVVMALYNYDVRGKNANTVEDSGEQGVFIQLIGEVMEWIIDSVSSAFDLKSYEDFFLIRNAVELGWVYGMFPQSWMGPALLLYAVSLTIAMSLIGFSILKILWKKQLSTVNIGEKIAMQENIKNLLLTMFLFFAFIPIFIFLAGLNVSIVKLFASSVAPGSILKLIRPSYTSFGSIVLALAELILKIYFNFFYVTRGITIAVLLGVSPLAIYTLSLGGKTSGVFSAYAKELISQIFVQSVHAIIAAFFFNVVSQTGLTSFEQIVVLYSFLPITKFIKTKVFQLTEGPAGQVASTGVNLAAGAMSGAAKGLSSAGKGKDGEGGKGNGRGGSGGKEEATLGGVMDRTASQQRSNAAKTGERPKMADSTDTSATPNGYKNTYTAKDGGSGGFTGQAWKNANQNWKDNKAHGLQQGVGKIGKYIGDVTMGTGMTGEANRSFMGNMVKAQGDAAVSALYGGLALGMGAVGENPNKYAEASAKHGTSAHMRRASALHDRYEFGKKGGIRDQEILSMQEAGIQNVSTNGSYSRYQVDKNNASEQHRALYEDLEKAYSPSSGYSEAQRTAAQNYYRDNYGIQNVTLNADPNNAGAMNIDMELAKMDAHRVNTTDPFEGMKTFKWREEKDDGGGK